MYWHRGPTKLHRSSGMYHVSVEQTPPNQGWRTNTPGRTLRTESARWSCTKLATNSWLAAITTCTRPGTTKLTRTTASIGPHKGQNSTTTSINDTENDTRLDYNICAIVGDSHQEQQVTLLMHLYLGVCVHLYIISYVVWDVTSMLISCVYNHLPFGHHVSSLMYSRSLWLYPLIVVELLSLLRTSGA